MTAGRMRRRARIELTGCGCSRAHGAPPDLAGGSVRSGVTREEGALGQGRALLLLPEAGCDIAGA